MIKFSQSRNPKLQEALLDVQKFLKDNHRFDEKAQKDAKFKDTDILAEFVSLEQSTCYFDVNFRLSDPSPETVSRLVFRLVIFD
jgi:hypothetical protein